jgi:hypothetical protein
MQVREGANGAYIFLSLSTDNIDLKLWELILFQSCPYLVEDLPEPSYSDIIIMLTSSVVLLF